MGGEVAARGGLPGAAGLPRARRLAPERGGVPIPPPPIGRAALEAEIDVVLVTLSNEQRAEPRFYPDNYKVWTDFFQQRYERELAAYDGPPPPLVSGRRPNGFLLLQFPV
ncbi:hypothetical protein QYE76_046254 [Lolium multiflorum]|uniref:Uncharacterized protein n=1 Tax=Lolium multiflorum TaxID=4521 RepID=A0AAD8TPM1_LOLMU|nr:hypothetical protein QYE76_046254 [Lolium multiflorum]